MSGVGSNVKFSAEIDVSMVEVEELDREMDFSEEDGCRSPLRVGFRKEKKPIFLLVDWELGN